MRVAIVTESFLPEMNGVVGSVLQVTEHLRAAGHQALVVAPGPGPATHHGTPVVRVPAVDLPVVDSMPVGLPTRRVTRALARFRPDVVHLASPFVVGARGLYAARRLGIPTVAVYQTDVAGFAAAYGLGRLVAGAAWRWTRWLHGLADRTLAPSSWAVQALTAHDVPRVRLWGRGVDSVRFGPVRRDPALRARLAPDGELLVGYVGRLAPEKQVGRLAALRGMPGVRLVVVGDGPDRAELARLLPDAAFLGFRTGDDLARAYASLDVFVHTGSHETFCQGVQEALASGVPVIAPDAGGPRDLVADGRTGFLIPGGGPAVPGALREAVRLLRDPGLRERFGTAGRESVRDRTWAALCGELIGHYRDVVGQQAAQVA